MYSLSRLIVAAAVAVAMTAPALAQNWGFEDGDLTGWGYAGNVQVLTTVAVAGNTANPTEGNYQAVLFTGGGVTAAEADALLQLPAGTIEQVMGVPLATGSVLWRDITLGAGFPTQSNDYDFLAGDYLPYDDIAFASLSPLDFAARIGNVGLVGDFGTTGWVHSGWWSKPAGRYRLGMAVFNALDDVRPSALAVDNFQGYADVPEPSAMATAAVLLGGVGSLLLRGRRNKG